MMIDDDTDDEDMDRDDESDNGDEDDKEEQDPDDLDILVDIAQTFNYLKDLRTILFFFIPHAEYILNIFNYFMYIFGNISFILIISIF